MAGFTKLAGVFGGYDAGNSGALEELELGDAGDDLGEGGIFGS